MGDSAQAFFRACGSNVILSVYYKPAKTALLETLEY